MGNSIHRVVENSLKEILFFSIAVKADWFYTFLLKPVLGYMQNFITSFVACIAKFVLFFIKRKKVRGTAIYASSMSPPVAIFSITFNGSTFRIRVTTILTSSAICASIIIHSNVSASDIWVFDPTSLSLAIIILKYFK